MIIVGVDPGLSGGIALLGDVTMLHAMPAIEVNGKGVVDAGAVSRLLTSVRDSLLEFHAFIESVHAMPKQGVASAFKFGRALGIIEGVVAGLGIPYTMVTPQRWQKEMLRDVESGSTKERAAVAATRLFPNLDFRLSQRSRKLHDGLCDAALIAEFGRRTLGQALAPTQQTKERT